MMLLERWVVAGLLGIAMISAPSPAQSRGKAAQPDKAAPAGKTAPAEDVVQPDSGPPPDQAVQPSQSDSLAPAPVLDPPAEDLPDPPVEPPSAPAADAGPAIPDQIPGRIPDQIPDQTADKIPDQVPDKEPDQQPEQKADQAARHPAAPPVAARTPETDASAEVEAIPANATPEERQLRKDAIRLLQLVRELKLEVEKAGTNTLSLDALRKAEEVQRLSRSLKERMREWDQTAQSK